MNNHPASKYDYNIMRITYAIAYFTLLIAICIGLGAWSAEDIYEIKDHVFHQRIFGFTLEIPDGWSITDNGQISPRGDYPIEIKSDHSDTSELYLSFFPVKGLSLIEFADEILFEISMSEDIELKEKKIGNLDCIYASISLSSSNPDNRFPELTLIFSRIGDHFLKMIYYSYNEDESNEILEIIRTIKFDDKSRKMSFLAVKNHRNYGIPTQTKSNSQLYLYDKDPSLMMGAENADGSETIIIDDFEYPARFPAGETSDDYGSRRQYYENGRYHVDNRDKCIDVYVPDINLDIRDFTMGVDIRFEGGHPLKGNGLVFRGSEDGFYLFDLSPDGFFALYRYKGGFETLVEKTFVSSMKPYQENRIEIQAGDNEFRLYVNNKRVKKMTVKDDLNSGFAGLYVCAGSWVSFDNYFIEVDD